ncbi:hypothetical protein CU098_001264, partial [Rhizopus stolonifer]
ISSDDEETLLNVANKKRETVYKSLPLPSDEDESSDDDCIIPRRSSVKPSRGSYQRTLRQTRSDGSANITFNKPPMNMTRSAEDLPRIRRTSHSTDDDETIGQLKYRQQQDYQMQQYHYAQQQQRKQMHMSGMDLLLQREQEKAESKRQKPKMVPGKVKIEGLLSKLPEPGTHNISFQQIQLQQKYNKKTPKLAQQPVYPVMYNPHAMMVPNTYYQLPNIPVSNGSLYMSPPSRPSRPSSVVSNRNHQRQSSSQSIPFV